MVAGSFTPSCKANLSRDAGGIIIGIESTAHTFSFGWVDGLGAPGQSKSAFVRPVEGGIHPREAADHHSQAASRLLSDLLAEEVFDISDVVAISFSQGPGLGPCLRVGASVARALSIKLDVPLIGVNHCVAHIEVGRERCNCDDPVLLYVSGGNTQIIARLDGRYRVLGETLDIGIGNMLDKFARTQGIPFPGGPRVEELALKWLEKNPKPSLDGLELPYAVQGMDLAFSGILNAALNLIEKGKPLEAVCWSLQEHAFAACVEVAERAMAHSGKTELLLGGGVACNSRIREMCDLMAESRGATSHVPEKSLCIDNGSMIATLGRLQLLWGEPTKITDSAIRQDLRTDETDIVWN
ncbi:MAG: bifunctional N(6)-L-threonylcarbamoyladenine synthase/serine/threonine protein kinase [Candidatus Thalassarchaeaceae archaeon]|nr:bifunctional N(6)-L-threonylcarbamoyladenine synthase/serine/threonine protein kinase [Candidatus Thalassarchaeaceae archaeon]